MASPVTQAELDIGCVAAKPLVDADIQDAEKMAPILIRRKVDQGVQEHRAEIDAYVRALIEAAVNAILKSRAG